MPILDLTPDCWLNKAEVPLGLTYGEMLELYRQYDDTLRREQNMLIQVKENEKVEALQYARHELAYFLKAIRNAADAANKSLNTDQKQRGESSVAV